MKKQKQKQSKYDYTYDYEQMQSIHNPKNEPVGHFTGRCKQCGSKNLWDDNMAYGCNDCDYIYIPQ